MISVSSTPENALHMTVTYTVHARAGVNRKHIVASAVGCSFAEKYPKQGTAMVKSNDRDLFFWGPITKPLPGRDDENALTQSFIRSEISWLNGLWRKVAQFIFNPKVEGQHERIYIAFCLRVLTCPTRLKQSPRRFFKLKRGQQLRGTLKWKR